MTCGAWGECQAEDLVIFLAEELTEGETVMVFCREMDMGCFLTTSPSTRSRRHYRAAGKKKVHKEVSCGAPSLGCCG